MTRNKRNLTQTRHGSSYKSRLVIAEILQRFVNIVVGYAKFWKLLRKMGKEWKGVKIDNLLMRDRYRLWANDSRSSWLCNLWSVSLILDVPGIKQYQVYIGAESRQSSFRNNVYFHTYPSECTKVYITDICVAPVFYIMHIQRIIWYDLEVSVCLAHSMLPDVTMSQWFDCQAPMQGPQLAAARDGQRTTTCHGAAWQRSGHIGNSPKHLGWRMQQMEKAWVMDSYGWYLWFDVDYGLQKPGLIYPNSFSVKKVKNGTHAHKCQKLTISTAGQQPSVFLNHVLICFFMLFWWF